MFILGDEGHYHGRFPWVTASLICINVVVFVGQAFLGEPFTNGYSLVPGEITSMKDFNDIKLHEAKIEVPGYRDSKGRYQHRYSTQVIPINHYPGPFPIFLTLLTSMFLHGDVFHLLGNMWFLLVFGRNVECALGHGRFIAFYFECGVCAGLAHVVSDPQSVVPCLGASGAISGVLGAYVAIHPLNRIKVWLGLFCGVIEVPALIIIGVWFLLQYLSAFVSLDSGVSVGVAYWAHLGGFVAGFLLIRALVLYLRLRQAWSGQTADQPHEAGMNPAPRRWETPPRLNGVAAGAPDPIDTFFSMPTSPKK